MASLVCGSCWWVRSVSVRVFPGTGTWWGSIPYVVLHSAVVYSAHSGTGAFVLVMTTVVGATREEVREPHPGPMSYA